MHVVGRSARLIAVPARVARARVTAVAAARAIRPVMARLEPWQIEWVRRSRSGTVVARLRLMGHRRHAYLKVARANHGIARLVHEQATLRRLADDERLAGVRQLIPHTIDAGVVEGWRFLLQEAVPGTPASNRGHGQPGLDHLVHEASALAGQLHGSCARSEPVGEDALQRWVHRPLGIVRSLCPDEATLGRLGDRLAASLTGHRLTVGWVHGDYWPNNLLVDARSGSITGIIDWDSAEPAALALHDQLHLVLYSRKMRSRASIGAEIARALRPDAQWSPVESTAVAAALDGLAVRPHDESLRVALILYWLRLVTVNLTRQPRTTASRTWINANVSSVIAAL